MTDRLRRGSTALAVAVLALLAAPGTLTQRARPQPSSIVFILSDDHAYNALGIAGHPHLNAESLIGSRAKAFGSDRLPLSHLCAPRHAPHF